MTTASSFGRCPGGDGRADSFAGRVVADTAGFAITVLARLGDDLGLFRALADGVPSSSAELAHRAGADERFVREWLSAMAAAGYVYYHHREDRFSMLPEAVPVLADEGGADFAGGTHQMLVGMSAALPWVRDAFRTGRAVPASAYGPDLWDGMDRVAAGLADSVLVEYLLPAMPEVGERLDAGVQVADVGCGGGRALIALARAFPASTYVGYDLAEESVVRATANAARAGVGDRLRFEQRDVAAGLRASYEVVLSFDVLHDAADPARLLSAVRAAMVQDGLLVCLEAKASERLEENVGRAAALLWGTSVLYCLATSRMGPNGGLGTLGLPETALRLLCRTAGFGALRRIDVDLAFNALYLARALPA